MIKKVKVLVVEDEAILAQDIAYRLKLMEYEVIGVAATAEKAIKLIETFPKIDLVILDIVIKGQRDGIELASIINKKYNIPFIFLTSHADQYLVERAKNVKPYAYILKPFNDRQVNIAIELALMNFSKNTVERTLVQSKGFSSSENQVLKIDDSLFLKKENHFERVLLKEILFLKADSNYTTIHTKNGSYVYATVLKKIEVFLQSKYFLRIHRSYVVNINLVSGFEGNLLFIENHKIPVSKNRKEAVFNLFQKI